MATRKLLVVDDMESIRALVAAIARDCGFEVTQAANGRQALAYCQGSPFDGVICDYNMPSMNGAAFIAALRETDQTTPVIMLTGVTERDTIQPLVGLGINGLILKPFKPDHIYRALENLPTRAPQAPAPLADQASLDTPRADPQAPQPSN